MNGTLIKIDVAAHALGWNVRRLEDLIHGGATLQDKALVWIFDFANDRACGRQDLRWWVREVEAKKDNLRGYDHYEIGWVIDRILPVKRTSFMPDELDEMFQTRRCTRTRFHDEFDAIASELKLGWVAKPTGNFYPRPMLAEFLKRRWLGAVYSRNHFASRAAATNTADTNK